MNRSTLNIGFVILLWLIGFIVLFYGYNRGSIIWQLIGSLIVLIYTKSGYDKFNYIREFKTWLHNNNDRVILFYAAKKEMQIEIEKNVIPFIPKHFFVVYYDGPNLVGDVKASIVLELMEHNSDIRINSPCLLLIKNKRILVEPIVENSSGITLILPIEKIKKIISSIANS